MSKGSAPRQQRDDKGYAEAWERIFRPKAPEPLSVPEGSIGNKKCAFPFCQCGKDCEVKNG